MVHQLIIQRNFFKIYNKKFRQWGAYSEIVTINEMQKKKKKRLSF